MQAQAHRAQHLRRIFAGFEKRVKAVFDYAEEHPGATLAELEREAWRLSRDSFSEVLQVMIESDREAGERECRCECGGRLRYKGEQSRSQETLVGRVRWSRGYYVCVSCGRGRYPLDEALRVASGSFSECVQEGAARLAVEMPFGEAAQEYPALTGISISAREIARITEERGAVLEERTARDRARLLAGQEPVDKSRRALVRQRSWAVALDAAKVRFKDGWHEVKAGAVFWVETATGSEGVGEQGRAGRARAREQSYIAEVGSMEEAGARLYAEVIERGVDPGEESLVCLADGAPGIWSQYALHFPHRVEVLDWYHAMEHLWAAGNGVLGEGTQPAKLWVAAQEQLLWDGRVEEVIANLGALAEAPGGEAAREQIHYFEVNTERMRYPHFRAEGYPIGSGVVESACKRVVGARLKQAGMCWNKAGARAVLALRTARLSNRWDQAWLATAALPVAA